MEDLNVLVQSYKKKAKKDFFRPVKRFFVKKCIRKQRNIRYFC